MKVDPHLIHRLFYPQVPLIMSAAHEGRVSAMPVVSYLSVSDSPPVVAVSCRKGGFTCKLALRARAFSLCLLDRSKASAVGLLGSAGGSNVGDKLAAAGLRHRKGKALGVPLLEDAVASLECSLISRKAVGEHMLLLAEVMAAGAGTSFSEFWDFSKYTPILYAGWQGGLTLYPGA